MRRIYNVFFHFVLETGNLWEGGHAVAASLYVILSVTLGVFAVFAGQAVVR